MQRLTSLTVATAIVSQVAFASTASAQSFIVFSARHDAATNQLTLIGGGFKSDMRVLMNGAPLRLLGVSSDRIKAQMPVVEPGT
jgi:hypothetical protein